VAADVRSLPDWGVTPSLKADGDETVSEPSGVIKFDPSYLSHILTSVPDASRDYTLMFISAHEIWHQVQFKKYGTDIASQRYRLEKILECQADMMATYYLGNKLGKGTVEQQEALIQIPTFAFGLAEFGDGLYHPPGVARRVAAQIGLQRAIHDSGIAIPNMDAPAVKEATQWLADIRDQESLISWSYRQCRMITHSDESLSNQISVGPNRSIEWNKPKDGVVTYSIPFTNESSTPLSVELEVTSASVSRTNVNDVSAMRRIAGSKYRFDILPGATFWANGLLPWYATDDLMPELLFPPHGAETLISASAMPPVNSPTAEVASNKNETTDILAVRSALSVITTNALTGFKNLRGQVSSSFDGDLSYACPVAFPRAKRSEVIFERLGETRISVDFPYVLKPDAEATYSFYTQALRSIFPDGIPKSRSSSNDDQLPSSTMQLTKLIEASWSIYKDDNGRYYVSLDFSLTRPAD
jgi:hypothetical protein